MAKPPLSARPPTDLTEERTLRRLASARHAPASLIQRARIITASWDGASVPELAERLGCHPPYQESFSGQDGTSVRFQL